MTENLPKDLVLTKGNVGSELAILGGVDVDDIIKLWRVYSTNSSILRDGVGRRLENFFWRIWGSKRIYSVLSGSTLATLFVHISDDRAIRTTTPATVKKVQPCADQDTASVSPAQTTSDQVSSDHHSKDDSSRKAEQSRPEQTRPGQTRTRLPSILKKPQGTPAEHPKTTRIFISDKAGENILRPASCNPQTPVPGTQNRKEPAPKQGRKKTAFVANTGLNSKRRPVLLRRKSSQQSSRGSSARASPLPTPQLMSTPIGESREPEEYFPKVITKVVEKPLPVEESVVVEQSSRTEDLIQKIPLLMTDGVPMVTELPVTEGPPPTSFRASSVYRHRSPERKHDRSKDNVSSKPLVSNDFRSRFAEKVHRESFGASSLAASDVVSSEATGEAGSRPQSGNSNTSTGFTGQDTGNVSISTGKFERSSTPSDNAHPILESQDSPYSWSYSRSTSPSRPRSQLSMMIAQSRRPSVSESSMSCGGTNKPSNVDTSASRPASAA
ncbi:conserved hypothetical protein [Paecilomyces variotii No. 5]|uniref:Nitrogen regulatory protein areA GATA-like domain-containing protein n=1 Tax=Byssochlamys spectabilis (strain No. 5 / NBRC 109023) TaxID=1356009 RepID=V5G002_BYSSN|nr:conserved hypothetical protein [Paecilomyces variotii No. 5]